MLNPSKSSYIYRAIQALYKDNPNRLSIFSGLHQNDDKDVLHYSVLVRTEHRCNIILHFNGYYKNFFIVKNITMNEDSETKMIADFTFIPLEPV